MEEGDTDEHSADQKIIWAFPLLTILKNILLDSVVSQLSENMPLATQKKKCTIENLFAKKTIKAKKSHLFCHL